jgi:SAM-dependent methyltransferase
MPRHPAKFTPSILDVVRGSVYGYAKAAQIKLTEIAVLDPFAGTGRIHELPCRTVGVELEREWAEMAKGTVVGDARALPFESGTFDVVATSPCYGNRFSDAFVPRDTSKRYSYTFTLGRPLTAGNAGAMHYRDLQPDTAPYRALHRHAWAEVDRVLKPAGIFLLNLSDFIANRQVQHVSAWHFWAVADLGFMLERRHDVGTPRHRVGANRERVTCEHVLRFRKPQIQIQLEGP